MSKRKNENQLKDIEIYAIVSAISNEIYVWKIKKPNHYQTYKEQVNGGEIETKELFKKAEEKKQYPKMYLLDNIKATEKTAFSYCIAWTKYFKEKGYRVIASPKVLSYIENLKKEAETVYQCINQVPIEKILCEEHLLVNGYRRIEKNRIPKDEIKITVSHKEYTMIQEKAKKAKMTMSRFCKNSALKGELVSPDSLPTLAIYGYMGELREAKTILKHLLDTIYRTGKYYPVDLENIQAMVDKITEQQNIMHKDFCRYIKAIQKILPH